MRIFVVTIPFTVERRVFSSLVTHNFDKGDTIYVYPANNLSDSEGLYWLDEVRSEDGEVESFQDGYGHLITQDEFDGHCWEL